MQLVGGLLAGLGGSLGLIEQIERYVLGVPPGLPTALTAGSGGLLALTSVALLREADARLASAAALMGGGLLLAMGSTFPGVAAGLGSLSMVLLRRTAT